MRPKQRIREDLRYPVLAENDTQNLSTPGCDFVDIRLFAVTLIQVGLLEALDSRNRILLRVAGEPPGPYGTTNKVYGTGELRHNASEDCPIELAKHEPLRAARRTRYRPDRRYVEAVLADGFKGTRARFEGQRKRFHVLRVLISRSPAVTRTGAS